MKSSVAAKELASLKRQKLSKRELLSLLELRNHIDNLERIYLRRRERMGLRIIAGAEIDKRITLEELINCLLMDLCD